MPWLLPQFWPISATLRLYANNSFSLRSIMSAITKILVSQSATNATGYSATFSSIQEAVDNAAPGDIIEIEAGSYEPFTVATSGTDGQPITIRSVSGAEDVVIDGTGTSVRALIEIVGQSHISVSGFNLQNAPQHGIYVEGSDAISEGITIEGNLVAGTGSSGIHVNGVNTSGLAAVDTFYLKDVAILNNEVTRTNTANGVNEAITLGAGVQGFVIDGNHVHNTQQYGIDVKAGAKDGRVSNNSIHDIEHYGIYIDAGSRTIENVIVEDNFVENATNGIVIARESRRDPDNPNIINVDIVNNSVLNVSNMGIMVHRHIDDSGQGVIQGVNIEGNSINGAAADAIRIGFVNDFASDITVLGNSVDRKSVV